MQYNTCKQRSMNGNRFNTEVEIAGHAQNISRSLTLCIKRGLANTETVNIRSAYMAAFLGISIFEFS